MANAIIETKDAAYFITAESDGTLTIEVATRAKGKTIHTKVTEVGIDFVNPSEGVQVVGHTRKVPYMSTDEQRMIREAQTIRNHTLS